MHKDMGEKMAEYFMLFICMGFLVYRQMVLLLNIIVIPYPPFLVN